MAHKPSARAEARKALDDLKDVANKIGGAVIISSGGQSVTIGSDPPTDGDGVILDASRPRILVRLGEIAVMEIGLILGTGATLESFEALFSIYRAIGSKSGALHWAIADAAAFCEKRWGSTYDKMIEVTGLSYSRISNMATVARKFSLDRRRVKLTFRHHEEVAAIESEEKQDYYLDKAVELKLTAAGLRAFILRSGKPREGGKDAQPARDTEPDWRHLDGRLGDIVIVDECAWFRAGGQLYLICALEGDDAES